MARTTGSHSETTGPKVRQTALALFARHGYAAVSMRQIAKEVGVQAGALYNYTSDKQSLLFDLMRNHMEELLEASAAATRDGDARARLEAFVRFHIRFHLTRQDDVFISYMELRNLTPENFAVVEGLRRAYETRLEAILADGVAAGHFTVADLKVSTWAVIGMITEMNTWFREDGRLSLAQVEQIYWDMVRKLVGLAAAEDGDD